MPNEAYRRDPVAFKRACHTYERTNPKGFLMRAYRNMLSRVVGIQKKEAQYYQGLPILPKTVFYCWALADDSDFWPLWWTWQAANLDRKLSPSVDRIDATRGYTLDNMRWVTHSQNSAHIRPEFQHRKRPQITGVNHWTAKRRMQQGAA